MKNKIGTKSPDVKKHVNVGRLLFIGFLVLTIIACLPMNVLAADDDADASASTAVTIWDKAEEIMKDVYGEILTISTIAAIVTAAIALLMMNFSKAERTITESRAWLKRILITWAILNGLGFIMAYITPFFVGGKWTG